MRAVLKFVKNETVLPVAVILAVLSAFAVPVDGQYADYIDFRTLGLLFCLMAVIAGIRRRGVFAVMARRLTSGNKGIAGTVFALVLAAFFLSMLVTNDVSLITLVPLTMTCFEKFPEDAAKSWLIPAVVLETIAANLGSMATPVGNPQNLYLYGLTDLSFFSFLRLILPYSALSLALLIVWTAVLKYRQQDKEISGTPAAFESAADAAAVSEPRSVIAYCILFVLCLAAVVRIVPWQLSFAVILIYVLAADRKTLLNVDYSLLGTFLALFVFIGNLGRIASFRAALSRILGGHEVFTAVAASQIMSNVPAAILLSGFTDRTDALIIGTNLGGLGTLIASMASLISYRIITKDQRVSKGRYLLYFTAANLVFLAALTVLYCLIG